MYELTAYDCAVDSCPNLPKFQIHLQDEEGIEPYALCQEHYYDDSEVMERFKHRNDLPSFQWMLTLAFQGKWRLGK